MTFIRRLIVAAALLGASALAVAAPIGIDGDYLADRNGNGLYDARKDSSAMTQAQPYAGSDPLVNGASRLEKDSAVPEPLSVGLMGVGLLGLALARRRRS